MNDQPSTTLQILLPHMKAVFDLVNIHVVITDPAGNIIYMNKAAQEKTGFNPQEAYGKNPGSLWGGNESEEFYRNLWDRIKNQKKPYVGAVHNKRKDGTLFWQELNISPIIDETGSISCYIAIETDITQQEEKQTQLQQQINAMFAASVNRETKLKELKEELERIKPPHKPAL